MNFAEQVEAVVRATTIHSTAAYSWLGGLSEPLSASLRRALPARVQRKYLLYKLQSQLYEDFYCRGVPLSGGAGASKGDSRDDCPFVSRLMEANSGRGFPSAG